MITADQVREAAAMVEEQRRQVEEEAKERERALVEEVAGKIAEKALDCVLQGNVLRFIRINHDTMSDMAGTGYGRDFVDEVAARLCGEDFKAEHEWRHRCLIVSW